MKNKKYFIKGSEEVYDAFDEFERSNPLEHIKVEASSIDDAVTKGKEILKLELINIVEKEDICLMEHL